MLACERKTEYNIICYYLWAKYICRLVCFGSAVPVSEAGQTETPESLAAPALAGFPPVAESSKKAALTT